MLKSILGTICRICLGYRMAKTKVGERRGGGGGGVNGRRVGLGPLAD